MSRLEEVEAKYGTRELIVPCDCADSDYLRMTWDDDPTWRWLWIESHHRPRGWGRVKAAWRALRGLSIRVDEVVLSDESVAALTEFLAEVHPAAEEVGG